MTWRFACPPLSSPMFISTVNFNEIIFWIENVSPLAQCKRYDLKRCLNSVQPHMKEHK